MESLRDATTAEKPIGWKGQREPLQFLVTTAPPPSGCYNPALQHFSGSSHDQTPLQSSSAHCLSCEEHLASQRRKGKISNWWLKTPQSRSSPTEKPAPCLVACPATPFHPSVLFKSHSSPYLAAQPEDGWPQEPKQATRSCRIHPL